MLQFHRPPTPRAVWVNSAIATLLFHLGLLGWGIWAWQQRAQTPSPAPIRIVTLPSEPPSAIAPAPPPTSDRPAIPESVPPTTGIVEGGAASTMPVAPTDTPPPAPSPEPVTPVAPQAIPPVTPTPPAAIAPPRAPQPEPSPVEPSPSQPTPQPIEPIRPQPSPRPTTNESPPSPAPVSPTPARPPAPATTEPIGPASPVESSRDPERPFPVTTGEVSPREAGVASTWTLGAVPDGADLPDELPRLPPGWRDSTAALFANASCSTGLVNPGDTIEITLWPNIEADGQISSFNVWDSPENLGNAAVVACVESLAPRMAPLIPATVRGEPIASYAILLTVQVQGTP